MAGSMIKITKALLPLLALLAGLSYQAGALSALGAEFSEHDRAIVFERRVLAIDKAMGDDFFGTILFYKVLLVYAPFNELSAEGAVDIDACIQFLAARSHTEQQKKVAALAMHLLEPNNLVIFGRSLIELYDRGQISYWQFIEALIPYEPFSRIVIDNFDHPGIHALLTDVLAREDIRSGEKAYIRKILSGELWAHARAEDAVDFVPRSMSKETFSPPPLEFMLLPRLFKWNDYRNADDRRAWIVSMLREHPESGNLVAKSYLDVLLRPDPGAYDDRDLEGLWRVWNSNFPSMAPGEMRAFLTAIRDGIAGEASAARPAPVNSVH
jgi:hypothetical protein